MKARFKSGDRAVLVQSGHDQQERVNGVVYDLAAGRSDWWFVQVGDRLVDGAPVDEDDLETP